MSDPRQLFCLACNDYVYDANFDSIVACQLQAARAARVALARGEPVVSGIVETSEERQLLAQHSTPYKVQPEYWGLRGLVNLGNTCFMNCILQAFAHNPLLRNFFLANMHNKSQCEMNGTHCLACEMDRLFVELFSGEPQPYTPAPILDTVWHFANYFAGYDQQDAHEFLITTLNGLHTHCGGTSALLYLYAAFLLFYVAACYKDDLYAPYLESDMNFSSPYSLHPSSA